MDIIMLKSKIHRATVTMANLDYIGSITIDSKLMKEANIYEYEKVTVADITNGNRLETYVIAGEENSGVICLNGAAAHLVNEGDQVIIMAYCNINYSTINSHKPLVLFVDENNKITKKSCYEKHGLLKDLK